MNQSDMGSAHAVLFDLLDRKKSVCGRFFHFRLRGFAGVRAGSPKALRER